MSRLILASASPRRRELLALTGFSYDVLPGDGEEIIEANDPAQVVSSLSKQKAEMILDKVNMGDVIIGADTVVSIDGTILGKPGTEENAFRMIRGLSGRLHEVFTGVTIIEKGKEEEAITFAEMTRVHVLPMTDEEIREYIATGEPMDKAGAYGIQGRFAPFVSGIEGDYANVVGLPVSKLYTYLKKYKGILK